MDNLGKYLIEIATIANDQVDEILLTLQNFENEDLALQQKRAADMKKEDQVDAPMVKLDKLEGENLEAQVKLDNLEDEDLAALQHKGVAGLEKENQVDAAIVKLDKLEGEYLEALQQKTAADLKKEDQVDAAIEKLDNLEDENLAALQRKREADMKKDMTLKEEWIANGHEQYSLIEIAEILKDQVGEILLTLQNFVNKDLALQQKRAADMKKEDQVDAPMVKLDKLEGENLEAQVKLDNLKNEDLAALQHKGVADLEKENQVDAAIVKLDKLEGEDLEALQQKTAADLKKEDQVDAAIEKLDNLEDENLAALQRKREADIKKDMTLKEEWIANGHEQYSLIEIAEILKDQVDEILLTLQNFVNKDLALQQKRAADMKKEDQVDAPMVKLDKLEGENLEAQVKLDNLKKEDLAALQHKGVADLEKENQVDAAIVKLDKLEGEDLEALQQKTAADLKKEDQVDAAIEKLDNLEDENLAALQRKREADMKRDMTLKEEWIANGHEQYSLIEIAEILKDQVDEILLTLQNFVNKDLALQQKRAAYMKKEDQVDAPMVKLDKLEGENLEAQVKLDNLEDEDLAALQHKGVAGLEKENQVDAAIVKLDKLEGEYLEALQQKTAADLKKEDQVDAAIEKLDNLEDENLAALQRKREADMKKDMTLKEEWIANGHEQYSLIEIAEILKDQVDEILLTLQNFVNKDLALQQKRTADMKKEDQVDAPMVKLDKLEGENLEAQVKLDNLKDEDLAALQHKGVADLEKENQVDAAIVKLDKLEGEDLEALQQKTAADLKKEDQVDAAIEKLDNLEDENLAALQRKREADMKKDMMLKEEWIANGHGQYSTLSHQKEFFEVARKSKNVVLHCCCISTTRCVIVDKHLSALATKHIETKFCKIDIGGAPFLRRHLKIRVIPTIILCIEGKTIDFLVGFDEFGGVEDFSTEMMEWRLAKSGVINYEEDLTSPPDSARIVKDEVGEALLTFQNFEDKDLALQQKRAADLKKEMMLKEEWIANGPGQYSTLSHQKEFFEVVRKCKNVVLHCCCISTTRCGILDKHLSALATKHIETKFCKIDIGRAPFLRRHLKIRVIPTIILCIEGKTIDFLVGFDEFGGVEDFSTEMMECRLAKSGVINYEGDLTSPPDSVRIVKDEVGEALLTLQNFEDKNLALQQKRAADLKKEDQVDAAIEKLDNLEDENLAAIQRKREADMKKEMMLKEEWIANGHGQYSTLSHQKEFFEVARKSKNVVLHCCCISTTRCGILDKHLSALATKHIETKFCKIDIGRAPFLRRHLKIRVIPTIILCIEGKTIDFLVGFDEFGGVEDFSTEMMEWRLAKSGVINYEGDLTSPPDSVRIVKDEVGEALLTLQNFEDKNLALQQKRAADLKKEDQVDAAIEKLDNLEDENLAAIQRKREADMKKEMMLKEEWIANGHGQYSTLSHQKEFFEVARKSKNVVLHCSCISTTRCGILDKHLSALATKHIETKFCKIDIGRAPFLRRHLKIRVIPTIILCIEGKTIDFLVGFDEFGGVEDFSTEMMEWRLAKSGVINYEGDLTSAPDSASGSKKSSPIKCVKKNRSWV